MLSRLSHVPLWQLRRERPWFFIVFLVLLVLFTVPVFIPDFLPFIDYPQHASEVMILGNYGNPEFNFSKFYYIKSWYHPYMAHRIAVTALAYFTGAELAMRLYIVLYLVAVPFGVLSLLSHLKRSPWPSILSFLGLYSFPLLYGFITYCVGTAAVIWGYFIWEKVRNRNAWDQLAWLAPAGLVIFLLHPHAFAYWFGTLPVLHALHLWRERRSWKPMFATFISLIPGFLLLFLHWILAFESIATIRTGGVEMFHSPTYAKRLDDILYNAGALWTDSTWAVLLLLIVGLFLLSPLFPQDTQTPPNDDEPIATTWVETLWQARYLIVVFTYLGGAFMLPENFGGQHFVASRFPSMAILILPLALSRGRFWQARPLIVLTSVLMIALGGVVMKQMGTFHQESRELQRAIDVIPRGAQYRCQIDAPYSRVFNRTPSSPEMPTYRHFCAYIQLQKGGLNGFQFRNLGIDYQKPYQISQDKLYYWQLAPSEYFEYETYGDRFDYYIVKHPEGITPYDPGQKLSRNLLSIYKGTAWAVYRRVLPFSE